MLASAPLFGRAVRALDSLLLIRSVSLVALLAIVAVPCALAAQSRLDGRVLDPAARPVPTAAVVVVSQAGTRQHAEADRDGRFVFDDLASGRYAIFASAPGLTADASAVFVGESPVSVDLVLRVAAINETLVVSAAQVDQPLSRTPDSVSIISGADLATHQIFTLGAALRLVPGFTVVQTGGPGTLTSIFPRGGESDYTLVLVDGVRVNGFGGGVDLSQVPLENVERIEVVSGPQSAVYGSDAIGGVIQIITRRAGRPSATARMEGGSRATRRVSGSSAGELGGWSWHAGGDFFEDEGFTGSARATGEPVSNDDARESQATAGLGWTHAGGTQLLSTFRYVETDRGAPGPYGSDPAGRYRGVDRVSRGVTFRRSGGVQLVHPWAGANSRIRQRIEVDRASYALGFTSAFGRSDSSTERLHARVQTDAALASAIGISGGVEWLDEEATSTFITTGLARVPIERRVLGTFAEARWSPAARLSVTAGLRAERIERDSLVGNPLGSTPRPDFAADTVVSANPKLAASWLLAGGPDAEAGRWTKIHAAAGTGIRPPDAFEIAFTDNAGLRPERNASFEAGVTHSLRRGALQLGATAFSNSYDDLIVSVGRLSSASRYRTDNIANARARGMELTGAWRPRAAIDLRASYTFLDTEVLGVDGIDDEAPAPYRVGDPLLRRPRHQGAINGRLTGSRIGGFAEWAIQGERLDAEPAFGPAGGFYNNQGYPVFNAGASVRALGKAELFGRISNMFAADYEEAFGFPAPGRLLFLGVRIAAGR